MSASAVHPVQSIELEPNTSSDGGTVVGPDVVSNDITNLSSAKSTSDTSVSNLNIDLNTDIVCQLEQRNNDEHEDVSVSTSTKECVSGCKRNADAMERVVTDDVESADENKVKRACVFTCDFELVKNRNDNTEELTISYTPTGESDDIERKSETDSADRNVSDLDEMYLNMAVSVFDTMGSMSPVEGTSSVQTPHSSEEDMRNVSDGRSGQAEASCLVENFQLPRNHSHTCWICMSPEYKAAQTEEIRAHHDALELYRCMTYNLTNLTQADATCYRKWFLTTATQYNHIELVNIILSDKTPSELDSEVNPQSFIRNGGEARCDFVRPLYVAITEGRCSLVEIFLHAGAVVTDRYDDARNSFQLRERTYDPICVHDVEWPSHIYEYVSAVEYACIAHDPEILNLIVAHFNSQHPPRESVERITRPLHLVMKLATQFYGQHTALLPTFVQMIIDAGVDVDCKDECGNTPLEILINEIRIIGDRDEVGTEHPRAIVEIAKILINAASNARNSSIFVTLLTKVKLPWFELLRLRLNKDTFDLAPIFVDYLRLLTDLARVLALSGADPTQSKFLTRISQTAAQMMVIFGNDDTHVCNQMLDCLCELYRVVLFAGGNHVTNEQWHYFLDEPSFADSFMRIVQYSFFDGGSVKLRDMMMSALSARNVNKLMNRLMVARRRNLRNMFYQSLHSYTPANPAIKYLRSVGKIRSLQDLARQTITRAVKVEALLSDTSLNIGLPPKWEALVRLL